MRNKFTDREKKLLSHICLIIAVLLILWIIFAPNRGMLALHSTKQEVERLQEENRKLAAENKALQDEITRLQDDPKYFEEKARKEYGMLKDNELLYIFKKKK